MFPIVIYDPNYTYTNKECQNNSASSSSPQIETKDHSIFIHYVLGISCCESVLVKKVSLFNHIYLFQIFTGEICKCICPTDLTIIISNLPSGNYDLSITNIIILKSNLFESHKVVEENLQIQ
jgi:hypothetical protein